jgi:hypothetical protein
MGAEKVVCDSILKGERCYQHGGSLWLVEMLIWRMKERFED